MVGVLRGPDALGIEVVDVEPVLARPEPPGPAVGKAQRIPEIDALLIGVGGIVVGQHVWRAACRLRKDHGSVDVGGPQTHAGCGCGRLHRVRGCTVPGRAESQIVVHAPGGQVAVQIGGIAGNHEARRETIGKRRRVVATVRCEIVHRRVDVARGVLIQYTGHQVPVGAEVLFDTRGGDARTQIDAGIRLSIADALRIGRRRQHDRLPIGEPTGIALVGERVVAVVQLQHAALPRAYVDTQIAQRTTLGAEVDVTVTPAVKRIQAIGDDSVTVDLAAEIRLHRADAVAGVGRTDLAQRLQGRPLGDEVEHARRIRGPIQRGGHPVDDLDLLELLQSMGDGDEHRHPIELRVLEVAALHTAGLGPQDVRPLLLLVCHQRQVLRDVPEVDGLGVLEQVLRQNADRVRRVQQRCRPQRPDRVHGRNAIVVFALPRAGHDYSSRRRLRWRRLIGIRRRHEHQGKGRKNPGTMGSVGHLLFACAARAAIALE